MIPLYVERERFLNEDIYVHPYGEEEKRHDHLSLSFSSSTPEGADYLSSIFFSLFTSSRIKEGRCVYREKFFLLVQFLPQPAHPRCGPILLAILSLSLSPVFFVVYFKRASVNFS